MIASGTYIIGKVDAVNGNDRIYPRKVVEEAIERYSKLVTEKKALGYCGTIDDPNPVNKQATHIVNNIQLCGDNIVCEISTLANIGVRLAKLMEEKVIEFRAVGTGKIDNGVISDYSISYIAAYPKEDVAALSK